MNTAELSLDRAPPLHIPLRFFLTAPLFVVAAGVLLLLEGETILLSRWQPATLALTHLITLGGISMVMFGAMSQMLPVIAGSPMPGIRRLGPAIHLLLVAGALALALGFPQASEMLLLGGAMALSAAVLLFLVIALIAIWRVASPTPSTRGMGLAVIALGITSLLGMALAATRAGHPLLDHPLLVTQLHHGWGLGGWMGLLIIAVAWQVVPMFHVTPEYPPRLRALLAPALTSILVVWSLLSLWRMEMAALGALLFYLGLLAITGVITWRLFQQRRRKNKDPTLYFWRLAIIALLTLTALKLLAGLGLIAASNAFEMLTGILILFGVILSVVCGMLLKIVPFLCWFHLHNRQLALFDFSRSLPSMKELLPDRWAFRLFGLHIASLGALIAAALLPKLAPLPALSLILQGGLLAVLLGVATLRAHREWLALRQGPDGGLDVHQGPEP